MGGVEEKEDFNHSLTNPHIVIWTPPPPLSGWVVSGRVMAGKKHRLN